MASKLTVSLDGTARVMQLLDMLAPKRSDVAVKAGLTRIALKIQEEVTTSGDFILHGRGDAEPLPDKLTSRHGGSGLVGSITPDYAALPDAVSVGSDLPYAGVHEDSRRAYLLPTYDKLADNGTIVDIMLEAYREHAGLE